MDKQLFAELVESMKQMKDITEATAPVQIARAERLEKDIQKQCVDWARKRGYWARKFSSMSQRSVPDYLFARFIEERRIKFFTEFKREGAPRHHDTGKMSTDAQQDEQAAMIAAGWLGFECDDFEHFKREVEWIEKNSIGEGKK